MMTNELPQKPKFSPTEVKIKSVCCSGTKSPWVCVPFKKPFPQKPPEPIAIFDCFTL